jgi:hypothetical protein
MMEKIQLNCGAIGLMNGTRRAILEMEELVDNSVYTFVHDSTSGFSKLRGGMDTVQGALKTLDEAFEQDVSPCPVVLSLSFVLPFSLPHSSTLVRSYAHPILHLSKARDFLYASLKKQNDDFCTLHREFKGKTTDGLFLSIEGQKVCILEAKLNLTVRRPVLSFASLFSLAACLLICHPPPNSAPPQNQYTSAKD